jgi:hypothetical protein
MPDKVAASTAARTNRRAFTRATLWRAATRLLGARQLSSLSVSLFHPHVRSRFSWLVVAPPVVVGREVLDPRGWGWPRALVSTAGVVSPQPPCMAAVRGGGRGRLFRPLRAAACEGEADSELNVSGALSGGRAGPPPGPLPDAPVRTVPSRPLCPTTKTAPAKFSKPPSELLCHRRVTTPPIPHKTAGHSAKPCPTASSVASDATE